MVREGIDPCLIEAPIFHVSAMTEEFHENLTHDIRYPDED
jgi:hypothetical protein